MQTVAASMMGFLLWFLMAISGLAGDQHSEPKKVEWVPATIGGAHIQVPLVRGLSIRTADHKNDFHLSTGQAHRDAEIRDRLRSMANTETALRLFNLALMIDKACESGVDVPLCRYVVVPPAEKAYVSWIQIIHRSDLAFAMETLHLKEAGEVVTSSQSSLSGRVTVLQQDQGHPYGCPPNQEFGHCRMYMVIADDLLAVMMFWREKDMSHLTPFAQMADAMGKTIAQLMKE